jgi:hypothetical protein
VPVDEHFPPVDWADVATKQDLLLIQELIQELALLGERLEAALDRGFRRVIVTMTSLMIVGYCAIVLAILLP